MSSGQKIAGTTPVSLRRRVLLKATAKALVGWIALATILSARIAAAGPRAARFRCGLVRPPWDSRPRRAIPPRTRHKRPPTCCVARQAMAENNLTAADSLISQAEALGVQYNFFYMGDTPKKARRDLDRKRNTAAGSPTKPSQIFTPSGSNANKRTSRPPIPSRAGPPIRPPALPTRSNKWYRCRR